MNIFGFFEFLLLYILQGNLTTEQESFIFGIVVFGIILLIIILVYILLTSKEE